MDLMLLAGALVAFILVIWFWVTLGARMWRQRERNAFAEKAAHDEVAPKGRFAVYLRAFRYPAFIGLDLNLSQQLKTLILNRNTGTDGRNGMRPLEAALADILDRDLPVIGLGRPHGGVTGSGAGLVRTTDAEWKDVATRLLDRCTVIVMSPAGTAGTAWEIEQLGARPEWREKTIYFMPNYQIELIRVLQPFVAGYEFLFGTGRFVTAKKTEKDKERVAGSVVAYAVWLPLRAAFSLLMAFVRFYIDLAFAGLLLFQRFAQSYGLRARWGKARRAGRKVGLVFPGYAAKGRIFTLDEHGKPHKLADLDDISPAKLKQAVLHFAKDAEKLAERRALMAPVLPQQPEPAAFTDFGEPALAQPSPEAPPQPAPIGGFGDESMAARPEPTGDQAAAEPQPQDASADGAMPAAEPEQAPETAPVTPPLASQAPPAAA